MLRLNKSLRRELHQHKPDRRATRAMLDRKCTFRWQAKARSKIASVDSAAKIRLDLSRETTHVET